MSFDRHRDYTQEQPLSDRGDGTVLAVALVIIAAVLVLLGLNVAL